MPEADAQLLQAAELIHAFLADAEVSQPEFAAAIEEFPQL